MLNAPINRVRIVLREFYFIFSLSLFSFDQTHASISLESAGEEEGGEKTGWNSRGHRSHRSVRNKGSEPLHRAWNGAADYSCLQERRFYERRITRRHE